MNWGFEVKLDETSSNLVKLSQTWSNSGNAGQFRRHPLVFTDSGPRWRLSGAYRGLPGLTGASIRI